MKRFTSDFLLPKQEEISNTYKILKENYSQHRILFPNTVLFNFEGKIKTCSHTQDFKNINSYKC